MRIENESRPSRIGSAPGDEIRNRNGVFRHQRLVEPRKRGDGLGGLAAVDHDPEAPLLDAREDVGVVLEHVGSDL